MVVYSVRQKKNGVQILVSKNLKDWEETQWVGEFYECPELYKLPVTNAPGEAKWVLQGGNGDHLIGDFDGRAFAPLSTKMQSTMQLPCYAAQHFNDVPGGRVIQIGWIRRHTDWGKESFSQMMSLPLEFQLRKTDGAYELLASPVRELEDLRGKETSYTDHVLSAGASLDVPGLGQTCDIEVNVSCPSGSHFVITAGKDRIEYADGKLNGKYALPSPDGKISLRILIDRPLIEVLGNKGKIYLPLKRESQGEDFTLRLSSEDGPATINSLRAWPLRSIWE